MDIIAILTESKNANTYWRVLKKRLIEEEINETVTKSNGLKARAKDGKIAAKYMSNYFTKNLTNIFTSFKMKI